MAQQIQLYYKIVATVEVNDGLTAAQIKTFIDNTNALSTVQTRFQTYRDAFKSYVRFLVGRPAAVTAGARIIAFHSHLTTGASIDEAEP